jgi:cell division protein FtsL
LRDSHPADGLRRSFKEPAVSVLTKVFIVLLVVLSLLTSAGLIVFVNQTEVYKGSLASATVAAQQANTQNDALKVAAVAAAADAQAARAESIALRVQLFHAPDKFNDQIASLNKQLADAKSANVLQNVALVSATAVATDSETQRTALAGQLTDTRTKFDDLSKQMSDADKRISDLVARGEVSDMKAKEFSELYAEERQKNEQLSAVVAAYGKGPGGSGQIAPLAPRIDAVVRSVEPISGIPHAKISVGSDDDVKVGMKFYLIDLSKKGEDGFLGTMIIDSVDSKESTGRLEGPGIKDVHPGVEVRTQI